MNVLPRFILGFEYLAIEGQEMPTSYLIEERLELSFIPLVVDGKEFHSYYGRTPYVEVLNSNYEMADLGISLQNMDSSTGIFSLRFETSNIELRGIEYQL